MKRRLFWILIGIILLLGIGVGVFLFLPGSVEVKDGLEQHSKVYIKNETVKGDFLLYEIVNMTSERLYYKPEKFTIQKKRDEEWITPPSLEETKEYYKVNDVAWSYFEYSVNEESLWISQALKQPGEYRFLMPCSFDSGLEFYVVGYFTVTAPAE